MTSETGDAFEKLMEIMGKLRGPDGCPWDRQQTHESLKKYLLEETYETIEAIDSGDMGELCGELGDLMLQIAFHAQLAKERGDFEIRDSLDSINQKLLRRHPHVFGEAEVACAEEVAHQWDRIKMDEKGMETRASIVDGVPKTLPALARAIEVSKRAARAGFEWPSLDAVFAKLEEEVGELREELHVQDTKRIAEEIGDLLFTIVNVARWTKVDPEDALRTMIERFNSRFVQIEEAAHASGRSLEDLSIEEMDAVWDRAKQEGQGAHEE
jgi:tetrapyrrole methylase family protein/MazG family protein